MLKFYTIKDISLLLGLNQETIRRWIREGKLNGENIGGRAGYRISKVEFDKFLSENKKLIRLIDNNIEHTNIVDKRKIIDEQDDEVELLFEELKNVNGANVESIKLNSIKYEYSLEMKKKDILNTISELKNEVYLIDYKLNLLKKIKDEML